MECLQSSPYILTRAPLKPSQMHVGYPRILAYSNHIYIYLGSIWDIPRASDMPTKQPVPIRDPLQPPQMHPGYQVFKLQEVTKEGHQDEHQMFA